MHHSRACISEILKVDKNERECMKLKLIVKMNINNFNKLENTILDTAAEINLITLDIIKSLSIEKDVVQSSNIILPLGGNIVGNHGKIKLEVNEMNIDFVVVDKITRNENILIGWPSLLKAGFSLSCINNECIVKLNGKAVEVVSYKTENKSNLNSLIKEQITEVRSNKTINLKPFTQKFLNIKVDNVFMRNNKDNQIFFTPSKIIGNTPIRVGSGIIDNKRKILISNWSKEPITIYKDALIGYASINIYDVFKLNEIDLDENEIIDDKIYIPDEKGKEQIYSKKQFISELEKLLESNNDLSSNEKVKLVKFLNEWRKLFAVDPKNPGTTTKTKCFANTMPNTEPIRCQPYRVSIKAHDELKKLVKEMLSNKVIEKSNSPWAFPVVLAIKSDGTWRFCVDYSKLNQKTIKDTFPLPNIEEYLDRLQKAKIFTVLDFASGFWQIPINEADKEKFSFITTFGTYQFNYMPFGFINAPSIFQRAISETLDPLLHICCLVYIDDVVIYSDSLENHRKDLDEVFKLLIKYNWKVKLSKCQFATTKIKYLGHEISQGRISPLDRNLEKLQNMKKPTNAEEMVAFLGVCGYYKKFIQGYDYIVHPLRKYTIRNQNDKKNNNFNKKIRYVENSMKSKVNIHGINPDKFDLEENNEVQSPI